MAGAKDSKSQKDQKGIEAAINDLRMRFGEGAIMKLDEVKKVDVDVISTGSLSLDLALGAGGVPRGRVIEIFGPESSGKTTLALHIVAEAQKGGGLCAFVDAEHALDPEYAKKIGVKIQDLLISQPDTGEQALEIVESLVRSGGIDVIVIDSVAALVPKAEIEQRVKAIARMLEIESLLYQKPKELSGGQRQRVALGRAIIRNPKVFLMDEPLSNLDAKLRVHMRAELMHLQDQLKTTTIYVTHDQVEAMTMGDRIVVLSEGKIQQIGTPHEIYHAPKNKFVAGFMGSPPMNFLERGILTIGVRPEEIFLQKPSCEHWVVQSSF